MKDERMAKRKHQGLKKELLHRTLELASTKAELKQVRELLEKERETFFPILHKAPYGIAIIDNDGNVTYINPAFYQHHGLYHGGHLYWKRLVS